MEKTSPFSYGLRAAALFAGVSIALTLVYYITGLENSPVWASVINIVVSITMLVYITSSYRRSLGGYMTFKQGFLMIFTGGIVASAVGYFFQLIYVNYIDTEYMEKTLRRAVEMTSSFGGKMDDSMMETMRASVEAQMSFSTSAFLMALFGAALMYAIAGAILAAVYRKNDPEKTY